MIWTYVKDKREIKKCGKGEIIQVDKKICLINLFKLYNSHVNLNL